MHEYHSWSHLILPNIYTQINLKDTTSIRDYKYNTNQYHWSHVPCNSTTTTLSHTTSFQVIIGLTLHIARLVTQVLFTCKGCFYLWMRHSLLFFFIGTTCKLPHIYNITYYMINLKVIIKNEFRVKQEVILCIQKKKKTQKCISFL